jgi:hypothetical protein
MAELSFGPRTFRQPVQSRVQDTESDGGFMGLGQHLAFLQGCVAPRPMISAADMPIVVDFPDRPAKMLAAVLPDYGPAPLLKVQLVDLPKLPLGKLRYVQTDLWWCAGAAYISVFTWHHTSAHILRKSRSYAHVLGPRRLLWKCMQPV